MPFYFVILLDEAQFDPTNALMKGGVGECRMCGSDPVSPLKGL